MSFLCRIFKYILIIIGMANSSRTSKPEGTDCYCSPANWPGSLLIHDTLLYDMQIKQLLHIHSRTTDRLTTVKISFISIEMDGGRRTAKMMDKGAVLPRKELDGTGMFTACV